MNIFYVGLQQGRLSKFLLRRKSGGALIGVGTLKGINTVFSRAGLPVVLIAPVPGHCLPFYFSI